MIESESFLMAVISVDHDNNSVRLESFYSNDKELDAAHAVMIWTYDPDVLINDKVGNLVRVTLEHR